MKTFERCNFSVEVENDERIYLRKIKGEPHHYFDPHEAEDVIELLKQALNEIKENPQV